MEQKQSKFPSTPLILISIAAVTLALCVTGCWLLLKGRNVSKDSVSPQLTQAWKSTPSDIEGMTKWDKYKAGLSVADGSDTDGDGLTDREELTVYDTDPLKVSTAGDLYADGYKVSMGMEPNKKYDYEGLQKFPHNDCSEVKLSAEIPTDFNAVVTPLEDTTQVMGLQVYAAYRVYNYGGKFSVDLTDTLRKHGVKLSDISVYVSDGADLERYSFSKDGNIVTLRTKFSADCTYTVYCAEDDFLKFAMAKAVSSSAANSIAGAINGITDSLTPEEEEEEITGHGLVVMTPILNAVIKFPIVTVCEDLGDDVKNEQLQKKISQDALYFLIREKENTDYSFQTDFQNGFVVLGLYNYLQDKLPAFDVSTTKNNDCKWYHFIFLYYSDDRRQQFLNGNENPDNPEGSLDIGAEESRPETDTVSGFHPQWDTLPFGNFKTSLSPNGSCAGIAHLTTYLYNTKQFPARSSSAPWDSEEPWDLMTDPENATLTNPGLRNYKDANFVTEHSDRKGMIDESTLTTGEAEFIKMIADTFSAANENAEFVCEELIGGDFNTVKQDYAVIEAAMKYLDSGKILTLYLDMVDGSRHAVNIFDYEISKENPDVVLFSIYDSNYPDNQTGKELLSETGFNLVVEKKLHQDGNGYTFGYDYFPTDDNHYGATSNPNRCKNHLFLILDESGHLLND